MDLDYKYNFKNKENQSPPLSNQSQISPFLHANPLAQKLHLLTLIDSRLHHSLHHTYSCNNQIKTIRY
ncbi:hypothetical protein L1987_47013 [Smallanthus sonchifolius]|uniref:Uncharacterized protein n=1 Tax=Smallanthus sonchifolius TaxID=185202 RepID=A0ACB9G1W6_9ASTR|nr:hypothetical protein L1987_47013 [Smallanthus sonchifolius]